MRCCGKKHVNYRIVTHLNTMHMAGTGTFTIFFRTASITFLNCAPVSISFFSSSPHRHKNVESFFNESGEMFNTCTQLYNNNNNNTNTSKKNVYLSETEPNRRQDLRFQYFKGFQSPNTSTTTRSS